MNPIPMSISRRPAWNALLHSQRAHHVRESIGNQPRDTTRDACWKLQIVMPPISWPISTNRSIYSIAVIWINMV